MMQLERLAYSGFIEFMHEFGGGSDSYLDMGPNHLREYLLLVKNHKSEDDAEKIFENVRNYLRKKDNMIQDYNFEAFEDVTGTTC